MHANLHAARIERQRGFSLVEVVVVGTILVVLIFAISALSLSGADAQEYARRLARATEIGQDVLDDMRLELMSAGRIFGDDAEGAANLAVFDLESLPVPLPGSRLPQLDAIGEIRRDTVGDEITGNSLFFARLAWSDRFACTSGRQYIVDVHRWVYYYLAATDGGPQPDRAGGLNLLRVVSEPLADAGSVDRIANATDRAEVLLHLVRATPDVDGVVHAPVEVVWARGGDPGVPGVLRQIQATDGNLSIDPIPGSERPVPWRVLRRHATGHGILAHRGHSVATNFSPAGFGIGRFGILAGPAPGVPGFPHGFEVQVVGPSSARQVLLHLVLVSTNRRGRTAWSDLQTVVDTRDM